jgi:hypothetical protein
MKKNIKDYLHLYLGCSIYYPEANEYSEVSWTTLLDVWSVERKEEYYIPSYKLVLRPLSDMTEDERKEIDKVRRYYSDTILIPAPVFGSFQEAMPYVFYYLLSMHFDLFGLIEAGLAIDKTKIIEQQNT